MRIVLCCLVLALAGCVVPRRARIEPVSLPDGTQGYSVHCGRDITGCMNGAAQVCGGPYQVINSEGHSAGAVAIPMGGGGAVAVNAIHHTLIVKCGAS